MNDTCDCIHNNCTHNGENIDRLQNPNPCSNPPVRTIVLDMGWGKMSADVCEVCAEFFKMRGY